MKVKTFTAISAKGLDKQVNDFIESEEVFVVKMHFSTSVSGLGVLIQYEEK